MVVSGGGREPRLQLDAQLSRCRPRLCVRARSARKSQKEIQSTTYTLQPCINKKLELAKRLL